VLSSIIDSHAALGALGRFNGLGSNPKPANPKKILGISSMILFTN